MPFQPVIPSQDPAPRTTVVSAVPSLETYFRAKIERGSFTNLDDGIEHPFLLNPTEWSEAYEARYVRQQSPGLSHEKLHYVGSKNASIPLTLFFDQLIFKGRAPDRPGDLPPEAEEWRRLLISYTYGRKSEKLDSASPPPILFYWPGTISMVMRVMRVRFHHTIFQTGFARPRVFTATVELEENLSSRIFADDIINDGTLRPFGTGRR